MIKLPLDDRYRENQVRTNADARHPVSRQLQTPCVVCGRALTVHLIDSFIHVVASGKLAAKPGEVKHGAPGDMGLLPIGTFCRRKYPELEPYIIKRAKGW